ncbi:MAG TPA: alpha-amylase family glycosyl hydrolase [Longilinea sp.]|nr:alpha-amylase family glycosyl hydrolase [Longilinea sp.]
MMEFHISRQSRDRYQFDLSLFSYNGNAILANFHAARVFAQKMNQKLDLIHYPEKSIKAGQINAMGLIDEILHHIVMLYRQQKNPKVMEQALKTLVAQFGHKSVDRLLERFTTEFPPLAVYRQEMTVEQYLGGSSDGISNQVSTLEELILLWVTNKNPAQEPYQELFSDSNLLSETIYGKAVQSLYEFFNTQPPFGPDQQNLIDLLRAPSVNSPYSLTAQLEFIRTRWADLLGKFLYRLLSSMDFIKEEDKVSFGGPGPTVIPVYASGTASLTGMNEPENFTPDREWMPRLVLLAKNTYVWLDQLGKKYGKPIHHLNEIPNEELATLAQSGFTGLWLIGLWERSRASAKIKQLCGNPEAISSAYSLFNYEIAADLGGQTAYEDLKERAWQHGIRLASDMVPNHMAIDSPWVIEHPDWFLSLDHSPFPSYTFQGPDLSADPNVSIKLEDHYFNRTDASVVFQRVNKNTGETRYVYHGNDGTTMPWNDTAQLNYLNPEVREAIIQTILSVARKFPIIRFDAAMTLAKKHYQRLWFPEPGTGGAIPSRAEAGLTKEQFDALNPVEFWREVVDRAAVEAPDTLLLAEAFWLMEGYFVRTLGMHRVYNSAFMNMLRNEENAGYRQLIKNTLEFEPEILKRYVNFMNNPDERTAVEQFGKGDKYFGICILMATMPGLPMFGHGQVEGYAEKYGMEFYKAYWDEEIDQSLVERHQREVFPLLHRRALFAGIENFHMYDLFSGHGSVDENVFVYSNRMGEQNTLVVFNNKFSSTQGWANISAPTAVKETKEKRRIAQHTLAQGLGIKQQSNAFVVFRDQTNNLEYVRPVQEIIEKGFFIQLNAYEYHVFVDFHVVQDDEWGSYSQLYAYLNGRGVPNLQQAMQELLLQPVQHPFQQITNPGYFTFLLEQKGSAPSRAVLQEAGKKVSHLLEGISHMGYPRKELDSVQVEILDKLDILLTLPEIEKAMPMPGSRKYKEATGFLKEGLEEKDNWLTLLGWLFTHNLGKMADKEKFEDLSLSWLEEWQFAKTLERTVRDLGASDASAWRMSVTLRLLISQQRWYEQLGKLPLSQIVTTWLSNPAIQQYLGVNRFKDVLWFNQEALDSFSWWIFTLAVIQTNSNPSHTASSFVEQILGAYEIVQGLKKAASQANFQVDKLLEALEE